MRQQRGKKRGVELIKKSSRLLKHERLNKGQNEAYTLHSKKLYRYKHLKINVHKRNAQWSTDLADLNDLSGFNNQYRYLLVCVDVYSRYAFVKALKTKSARNVANKFEQILLEEDETPLKIQSDEGTEFALIKRDLAKKYNFQLFHTYNRETKAVHAERFIETLKEMIRRSLSTLNQGYNYIQNLDLIVERYNESPHKSLYNLTRYDVYKNGKTVDEFRTLKAMLNNTKPTLRLLKKGDSVRIARLKNNIFEKSSLRRWVKEKFCIKKVFITDPVTYELEDEKGENIKGIFYREELQKI
jgi:thioredoxin-related protein